jgi:hypothetical protein
MARKRTGGGMSPGYRQFLQGAKQGQRLSSQQHDREVRARRDRDREQGGSHWTPASSQNPDAGVIEGTDHVVSFKTGGRNGDETLIVDGDYSKGDGTGAKEAGKYFDDHHDHYGSKSKQEGGWIDQVRGLFSG